MKQSINVKEVTSFNNMNNDDYLNMYYREVKKYKILNKEQEQNLFKLINDDNPIISKMARDQLIKCNQRFVIAIAKKYTNGQDLLDLIEEGNIGLINCIDMFKPEKGNKFITWAVWFIRRAIIFYRINSLLIKKTNINRTYHAIAEASNKFLQTNERLPTDDELVSIINKNYGIKISKIEDVFNTSITYIDSYLNDDDNTIEESCVEYNNKCSSFNFYENKLENEYNKELIKTLLCNLSPKEKKIISMSYGIGYDREYTVQEISDEINLCNERVRQLINESLNKLRKLIKKIKYNRAK